MVREAFSFSHAATNTEVYKLYKTLLPCLAYIVFHRIFSFILAYGVKHYFECLYECPSFAFVGCQFFTYSARASCGNYCLFKSGFTARREQNAHSEILAFLMMVLGMNLLMGGLIVTVITAGEPNMLFYLTHPLTQSAVLGLVLTITGFLVLSVGFIMVVHYDGQRSWHLKEIEKSTHFRNRKITIKTQDELLKGLADESSEK
jgi:hypothetical protein